MPDSKIASAIVKLVRTVDKMVTQNRTGYRDALDAANQVKDALEPKDKADE